MAVSPLNPPARMADRYDPHDPQTITEWYCCQCARYHGIPPPRYDCTRCTHMMCPYCPKRRVKDTLHQPTP